MSTVRDLLRCSEGKSVRAIAGIGISKSTVQRADVPKLQPAEMGTG
jgi:hypothetical protein